MVKEIVMNELSNNVTIPVNLIDIIIECVKNNSGYHWGWGNHSDGSVFMLYLNQNKISIGYGDRFLQPIAMLNIASQLLNKLYHNCSKPIFIGEVTEEQKLKILKLNCKSISLKEQGR